MAVDVAYVWVSFHTLYAHWTQLAGPDFAHASTVALIRAARQATLLLICIRVAVRTGSRRWLASLTMRNHRSRTANR